LTLLRDVAKREANSFAESIALRTAQVRVVYCYSVHTAVYQLGPEKD